MKDSPKSKRLTFFLPTQLPKYRAYPISSCASREGFPSVTRYGIRRNSRRIPEEDFHDVELPGADKTILSARELGKLFFSGTPSFVQIRMI